MLELMGWTHAVGGGSYERRGYVSTGDSPGYAQSAHGPALAFEVGDTITDANGLSDTIVGVVNSRLAYGKLSYDSGHAGAWANGLAVVTRPYKPRRTVDMYGPVSVYTDVSGHRRTNVDAAAGSIIHAALEATTVHFYVDGWDGASTVVVTPSATGLQIGGAWDAAHPVKTIVNAGPYSIEIVHNNASQAAFDIYTTDESTMFLGVGDWATFTRDTDADRWRAQRHGALSPGSVPGLLKWHDASVSSSVVLSGSNVTQWSDLSGNDRHDVVGAGVSPTYAADVITFGATQSLQYTTEGVDTLIGSKEFLYVVDCGTGLRSGALPGIPRLYFNGTAVSYNSLNVLTYSDASGVLVIAHDGSDIFVRRDGVEMDRATLALSAMTTSAWYAAVTATCTMTRYALYDASGWGASFAANLAAVETAFGV